MVVPELNGDSWSSDSLCNDNREAMTKVDTAYKTTVRLRRMEDCIVCNSRANSSQR